MFENFPYTNFHEINLDWILNTVKGIHQIAEHIPETVVETINNNPAVVENAVAEYTQKPAFEQLIKNMVDRDVLYINVVNPPAGYAPLVGDGVTDNTSALTALGNIINACLFFPEGTYLTAPVVLHGSVTGAGHRSIIKRKTPYTQHGDYLLNLADNLQFCTNVTIDDSYTGQIATDMPTLLIHDKSYVSNISIIGSKHNIMCGSDCIISVIDSQPQTGSSFVTFTGSGSVLLTTATHKPINGKDTTNYCIPDDLSTDTGTPYIDVSTYGVLPGNADNSAAMAAMLQNVESGATLVFYPGEYHFNSPIVIDNTVKMIGSVGTVLDCSQDGIIINSGASGTVISDLTVNTAATGYTGITVKATHCSISNIIMVDAANDQPTKRFWGKNFLLVDPWYTEVVGCVINPYLDGNKHHGIGIDCVSCVNVLIRGVHIGDKETGIRLSDEIASGASYVCDGVQIDNCNIVNVVSGINVQAGANMLMNNTIIDQCFGWGVVMGSASKGVQGVYIDNCYLGFLSNESTIDPSVVHAAQLITVNQGYNISVNNTTFRCQTGITPTRVLDYLVAMFNTGHISFVDCEFVNANTAGLLFNTDNANHEISVIGCKFTGVSTPVSVANAGQIHMMGCIGCQFAGVQFSGQSAHPLPINGMDGVQLGFNTAGSQMQTITINHYLGYTPTVVLPVVTESTGLVTASITAITADDFTVNIIAGAGGAAGRIMFMFIK